MDIVREITLKRSPVRHTVPRAGDTVKVSIRVKEGGKERIQIFEGVVIKTQGRDYSRSLTVRKISHGIGVEKTMLLASPNIAGIETISHAKVRRAKLYYLRQLKGRAARLKAKGFSGLVKAAAEPAETAKAEEVPKEDPKEATKKPGGLEEKLEAQESPEPKSAPRKSGNSPKEASSSTQN